MPVINTPSIWDYLAQAGEQGVQNFQQAKAETDRKNLEQAGLVSQLFNQGAIDSDTVNSNPVMKGMGIKVAPNSHEMARKFQASPTVNPATGQPWTAEDRAMAGLPSAGAVAQDATAVTAAQTAQQLNVAKQKYITGQPLNDQEYAALGLPAPEEIAASRAATKNQLYNQVGPKYLDTVLAPAMSANNGRIPVDGWRQISDQAFQAYAQDAQSKGLAVDPGMKAYFNGQLIDRLQEQRKLDNAQLAAENEGRNRASMDPTDRAFQALTPVIESRRKALDDLQKGDAMLPYKLANPKYANDPNVVKYNALNQAYNNAVNAQSRIALAGAPAEAIQALGAGASPSTPAPSGGLDVNAAIQMIQGKKGTLAQLKQLVGTSITQAEYDAVANGLKK